jgi:hypothetical protein
VGAKEGVDLLDESLMHNIDEVVEPYEDEEAVRRGVMPDYG